MKKPFLIILAGLMLCGCGTSPENTASDKPSTNEMTKYTDTLSITNYKQYFDLTLIPEGTRGTISVKGSLSYAKYENVVFTISEKTTGTPSSTVSDTFTTNLAGNGSHSSSNYFCGIKNVTGTVSYWF